MSEHACPAPSEAPPPRPAPRDAARPWARRACRRFGRAEEGATAVEFGLIVLPFLALLFAIIETALTFMTTQVMENAVEFASRQIYTGQFQRDNRSAPASDLPARFKTEFCKKFIGLTPCSEVKIDVQVYTSTTFPSTLPSPIKNDPVQGNILDPDFGKFANPQSNQIVVVRAVTQNPVFVSLLNPNQTNLSNGKRLIVGTAAFRTEPF